MAGIRIVEGVEPEDRVAFGLPAPRLLVAASGLIMAMGLWGSPLPAGLRMLGAGLVAACAAVAAWGRAAGRPVLDWCPLVVAYTGRRWHAGRAGAVPASAHERRSGRRAAPSRALGRRATPDAGCARRSRGRRVAVFSLEPAVGRTTLATELAVLLAHPPPGRVASRTEGEPVVLVDFDVDAGGVADRLGLDGPSMTGLLGPGPVDQESVRRLLVPHPPSGFVALLAPTTPPRLRGAALAARAVTVLDHLDGAGCSSSVIDLGPGVTPLSRAVLGTAADVVVVLGPGASVADDAARLARALAGVRPCGRLHLVCNRARPGTDPTLDPYRQAAKTLGIATAIAVPWDGRLALAERTHVPAALTSGAPPPALAALAAAVAATPGTRVGGFARGGAS